MVSVACFSCNGKAMQLALYHNGPVAIGFEVTADFFKYK